MQQVPNTAQQPPQPLSQEKKGGKQLIIIAIVVLLILIGGFFFFSNNSAIAPVDETSLPADEMDPILNEGEINVGDDLVADGEVKEFTVSGTEFQFDASEIRVNQGDTVRITLTNDGTMPHDWRVDEFAAATAIIPPGQQGTVEFTADQAGEFEYYCSVGQHRQQGMVGTLIVE